MSSSLTEEQEKDLDEMAKRFSETLGEGSQRSAGPSGDPAETKGGS